MAKYYLDTNICSYFMSKKYPNVSRHFKMHDPADLAIPSIVAAELAAGVENSPMHSKQANRADLSLLLQGIQTTPWTSKAIWVFGQQKTRLWNAGLKISEIDLLLGCQAIADDVVFVTNNIKHFERIDGLRLENWI
jgi:tRNA(fMet)-specific endonuclease VapC